MDFPGEKARPSVNVEDGKLAAAVAFKQEPTVGAVMVVAGLSAGHDPCSLAQTVVCVGGGNALQGAGDQAVFLVVGVGKQAAGAPCGIDDVAVGIVGVSVGATSDDLIGIIIGCCNRTRGKAWSQGNEGGFLDCIPQSIPGIGHVGEGDRPLECWMSMMRLLES